MSFKSREAETARTRSAKGKVRSPAWMTSRRVSFRSASALRIEGVRRGELVLLIS